MIRGALCLDLEWNMTEALMMTNGMVVLEITRKEEIFMTKIIHPVIVDTLMTTPTFAETLHNLEMRAPTPRSLMEEMI